MGSEPSERVSTIARVAAPCGERARLETVASVRPLSRRSRQSRLLSTKWRSAELCNNQPVSRTGRSGDASSGPVRRGDKLSRQQRDGADWLSSGVPAGRSHRPSSALENSKICLRPKQMLSFCGIR